MMTQREFKQAVILANEGLQDMSDCDREEAYIATAGCAYEKRVCTLEQVACLINYQTMQMNGSRDAIALQELYDIRHNLVIIG